MSSWMSNLHYSKLVHSLTEEVLAFLADIRKEGDNVVLFDWWALLDISTENALNLLFFLLHACRGRYCIIALADNTRRILTIHFISFPVDQAKTMGSLLISLDYLQPAKFLVVVLEELAYFVVFEAVCQFESVLADSRNKVCWQTLENSWCSFE